VITGRRRPKRYGVITTRPKALRPSRYAWAAAASASGKELSISIYSSPLATRAIKSEIIAWTRGYSASIAPPR